MQVYSLDMYTYAFVHIHIDIYTLYNMGGHIQSDVHTYTHLHYLGVSWDVGVIPEAKLEPLGILHFGVNPSKPAPSQLAFPFSDIWLGAFTGMPSGCLVVK